MVLADSSDIIRRLLERKENQGQDPGQEARAKIFEAIERVGSAALDTQLGRGVQSVASRLDPTGLIEDPAAREEAPLNPFNLPAPLLSALEGRGVMDLAMFGPSRAAMKGAVQKGVPALRAGLEDIVKRRRGLMETVREQALEGAQGLRTRKRAFTRRAASLQRGTVKELTQRKNRINRALQEPFKISDRMMGEIDDITANMRRRISAVTPSRTGKQFTPKEIGRFNDRAADEVVGAFDDLANMVNMAPARGGPAMSPTAIRKIVDDILTNLPKGINRSSVEKRLGKLNILEDTFGFTTGQVRRTLGGRKR